MADYNKELEEAKRGIAEAQSRLLEVYFGKIREYYQSLGVYDNKRPAIITKLENIVQNMSQEQAHSHKSYIRSNSVFDNVTATEIRKKFLPVLADLVREIGGNNERNTYMLLNQYEKGRRKPANPPRGKIIKKYVEWLKDHGYNPFNL